MYKIHYDHGKHQLDVRLIIDMTPTSSQYRYERFRECLKVLHDCLKMLFAGSSANGHNSIEFYEPATIWFQNSDTPFEDVHLDALLMIEYDVVQSGAVLFLDYDRITVTGNEAFTVADGYTFCPPKNYVALRFVVDTRTMKYDNQYVSFVEHDFRFEGSF